MLLIGLCVYWFVLIANNFSANFQNQATITQLVVYKNVMMELKFKKSEMVSKQEMRFDICYAVNTSLHKHGLVFIDSKTDVSMHIAIWFKLFWNTPVSMITIYDADVSYLNMHLHKSQPSINNIVIVQFKTLNGTGRGLISDAQKKNLIDTVFHSWVVVLYRNNEYHYNETL